MCRHIECKERSPILSTSRVGRSVAADAVQPFGTIPHNKARKRPTIARHFAGGEDEGQQSCYAAHQPASDSIDTTRPRQVANLHHAERRDR